MGHVAIRNYTTGGTLRVHTTKRLTCYNQSYILYTVAYRYSEIIVYIHITSLVPKAMHAVAIAIVSSYIEEVVYRGNLHGPCVTG